MNFFFFIQHFVWKRLPNDTKNKKVWSPSMKYKTCWLWCCVYCRPVTQSSEAEIQDTPVHNRLCSIQSLRNLLYDVSEEPSTTLHKYFDVSRCHCVNSWLSPTYKILMSYEKYRFWVIIIYSGHIIKIGGCTSPWYISNCMCMQSKSQQFLFLS